MGKRHQRGRHQKQQKSSRGRHGHTQPQSEQRSLHHSRPHTGVIQKNPRGFAFVIPRDRKLQDAYVSRQDAALLLSGDVVEYRLFREGKRFNAQITKILERGQKKVVGWIRKHGKDHYLETPAEETFWINGPIDPKQVNHWAIGDIVAYPTKNSDSLVRISKHLGEKLGPETDILVATSQFGLPDSFSPKALEFAENSRNEGQKVIDHLPANRKDLRNLPFVTIDGPDAKDFDDAICVEAIPDGFRLYVAIADVSFYVPWNSPLDRDARERGTSVYLPGHCIPMLPEVLSNDACSLRPQEDKLTLTAQMDFSRHGEPLGADFYESIIKTRQRLTYLKVHEFFDEKKSLGSEELDEAMKRGRALFRIFENARRARGVLDFELGESEIVVDKNGVPTDIRRAPRYESHRLIEEFMIAANSAVAKVLRESKIDALYRIHETPDIESLEEINRMMQSLGISHVLREATPKAFAHILAVTKGLKGSRTLHQTILRAQKQARYEPDPKGHFGLALRDYAHFTSPIRRYPDLVVHRALKQLIYEGKSADIDYVALGESTSQRERRAMEAERFVTRRKQCWFLEDSVGETMKGIVSGAIEKGCFIELEPTGIEGFLPIDRMPGSYVFDEERLCFRRRPGHTTISIGDPMTVLIEEVKPIENQITLGIAP